MPCTFVPKDALPIIWQDTKTATSTKMGLGPSKLQPPVAHPRTGMRQTDQKQNQSEQMEVPPPGLPMKTSQLDPMRPIKAPRVDKVQTTKDGHEGSRPKLFIPLYPSTKWGEFNPKLHQYWKEKEIKARERRLLSKAVPKSGGPWSGRHGSRIPQVHQVVPAFAKPGKTGKGSSKGRHLRIIKVIQKAEKKMGVHGNFDTQKSSQKGEGKLPQGEEVQMQEIHPDQTPEWEGNESPQKFEGQIGEEEDQWDICEKDWELEGNENWQGCEQGPWTEEEAWYRGEAGFSGEGIMEDTEGEE